MLTIMMIMLSVTLTARLIWNTHKEQYPAMFLNAAELLSFATILEFL